MTMTTISARRERQRPTSRSFPGPSSSSSSSSGEIRIDGRKVARSLPLVVVVAVGLIFLSSAHWNDSLSYGRSLPSSSSNAIAHAASPLSLADVRVGRDRRPPSRRPPRILALGGSVTWGGGECVGDPRGQAYPHVLGRMLGPWWHRRGENDAREGAATDAAAKPAVVHNLALRGSGSFFPSMCVSSMVRDRLRRDRREEKEGEEFLEMKEKNGDEKEPDYDVVLLEFSLNGVQGLRMLLWRLRRRYPNAVLLYVHLRGTAEEGSDDENGGSKSVERIATLMREVGGTVWAFSGHDGLHSSSSLSPSFDEGLYCSDHWHLSPRGHDQVAQGLFEALTAVTHPYETNLRLKLASNAHSFPFASQNGKGGTWGLSDVCHLWYHTGQMPSDVKPSGGRMNLFRPDQRKFAYEVPMEGNEAASFELSVSPTLGTSPINDKDKGAKVRISRKVRESGVPVYLSHMTYGAPGFYPTVDVAFSETASSSLPIKAQRRTSAADDGKEVTTRTRIDPSKNKDGQHAGLHLTEMSEVGRARFGRGAAAVKVRVSIASDARTDARTEIETESEEPRQLQPFRVVGLSACGACVEMGFDEYADRGMRRCRKEKCFL